MKKAILFGSGFICGILATILIAFFYSYSNETNDGLIGLSIAAKKGDCIPGKEIEVFQVLKPNMALANSGKFPDEVVVLLINYDGNSYYDNQKIKIPANKCAKQIGNYEYTTKSEIPRNIPAVVIE